MLFENNESVLCNSQLGKKRKKTIYFPIKVHVKNERIENTKNKDKHLNYFMIKFILYVKSSTECI